MADLNKFRRVCILHFIFVVIVFQLFSSKFSYQFEYFYLAIGVPFLFLLAAASSFRFTRRACLNGRVKPEKKAVLITGCDRGFGHLLAKRLDSKGYQVFACCLSPSAAGAQALRSQCSSNLQILELDVTNDKTVKKVFEFVRNNLGDSELWAVVNNAGIAKGCYCDLTCIQDFKSCIEVNAVGIIRIVKTFLPLLKRSRGRIINLTSYAGRQTGPGQIAYSTSKYAAVGFSDCSRHELHEWGIRVISVEPTYFRTSLISDETFDNILDSCWDSTKPETREDYGEQYIEKLKEAYKSFHRAASTKLDLVIDALESAISSEHPEETYKVIGDFTSKVVYGIFENVPRCVQDKFAKMGHNSFPKPALIRSKECTPMKRINFVVNI